MFYLYIGSPRSDPDLSFLPGRESKRNDAYAQYEAYFREELEIPILIQGNRSEKETLEGILDLLAETCSSKRKTIRIAGDDKPIEIVKNRLMKLNSLHIQYVLDCLKENTTYVRDMKQYRDDYLQQKAENPERRILRSAPADAANRGKLTSRQDETEKAVLLNDTISGRQDRNRPSASYSRLMKAVDDYAKAQRELNERIMHSRRALNNEYKAAEYRKAIAENRPVKPLPDDIDEDYRADPDASYDAIITSGDLLELKELGRKVQEAADEYLKAGDDKGKNAKRRREIAKTASTFGKNAADISEEELETAERNERRALDRTNRRVGDALEATGWKDGEESTLTRDDKVKRISVGGEEPEPAL